jgi:hypothetical protein
VNVIGPLVERLSRRQRDFLAAFDLHDDRSLQHVDHCVRIVPVDRVDGARRIFHCDHQQFLAGVIRQGLRQQRLYDGLVRSMRAGRDE